MKRMTWWATGWVLLGTLVPWGCLGADEAEERAVKAFEKMGAEVTRNANGEVQKLDLGTTKATDAGLKELAGLKHLQTLDLRNTKVTYAGVEVLRKKLPKCKILK